MMKDKKGPIAGIIILVLAVSSISLMQCSKKRSAVHGSTEELARFVIERMHEGDSKTVIRSLVTKSDFIRDIYPHTEEAQSPGALSGADYWRIHMEWRRINGIIQKTNDYRGMIVSFDEVGKAKNEIEVGPYRFLQAVPVTLTVRDEYGSVHQVVDDRVLGVVVQKGDAYMLLNVRK